MSIDERVYLRHFCSAVALWEVMALSYRRMTAIEVGCPSIVRTMLPITCTAHDIDEHQGNVCITDRREIQSYIASGVLCEYGKSEKLFALHREDRSLGEGE